MQHTAYLFSSCNAGGKALGCPPTGKEFGCFALYPTPALTQPCSSPSPFPTAGHKNAVLEVHWTTDGERILSASPDKSVRAWDARTGEQVKKMAEHDNFVNSCCPLKRGPPLLCSGADDGNVKVCSWLGKLPWTVSTSGATRACCSLTSGRLCGGAANSSVGMPDCTQRPAV